jgi:hypothetical protein
VRNVARYPPNPWLTLSLAIAAVLTAWPQPHDSSLAFFVIVAMLVASLRFELGPLALIALFLVGLELRVAEFGLGGTSDVPETIKAALHDMVSGGNPYAPVFDPSLPNRQPFPYGPLSLLWYAPLNDPRLVEFGVSIGLLAALAIRGRPMGLAVWATAPLLYHLASDGSNDHSAGLFLLIGIVVLERMPRAGAALIGVAAGFKVYALAWLPPVFVWLGAGAFLSGILGFVVVWLPAVIAYGLGNILDALQLADAVHHQPYYSLGEVLSRFGNGQTREFLNELRLVVGAITALVVSRFARSHGAVVAAGIVIYMATLYSGFWSTSAYLVPPALLVCWYIDVWLGRDARGDGKDETRIRWPRDPIGRLIGAVDLRWPKVATG